MDKILYIGSNFNEVCAKGLIWFKWWLDTELATIHYLNRCWSGCQWGWVRPQWINILRLRQNGRHFPDDTFKCIILNENVRISIKISLKFVPKGPMNKIPALVQIMAWRRPGDKPLSEPMMVRLMVHICVTLPQWVKAVSIGPMSPQLWSIVKGDVQQMICDFSGYYIKFSISTVSYQWIIYACLFTVAGPDTNG